MCIRDSSASFSTRVTTAEEELELTLISGSAQLESQISGAFTDGFEFDGTISGSATSTGSFGHVFVDGNILGNSDNTTEIGGTPDNGAIKKISMVQGGEIAFGDTTNSNFFGIAEGTNNSFGDSDTMGIYYRNGLNIYSANNSQRVKILANGNVGINDITPSYKLDVNGTAQFVDDVTLGADISGSHDSTGSFGRVVATKLVGDGSGITGLTSAAISTYNNASDNRIITLKYFNSIL